MRTLYGKLVALTAGVMLVGFILLTAGLNYGLESYFISQKTQELVRLGSDFQTVFDESYSTGNLDNTRLNREVSNLERYIGANVWIVSQRGQVFVSPGITDYSLIEKQLNLEDVTQVFTGKIVQRQGFIKPIVDDAVLIVGYPIRHNNEVVLALFMNVSLPEINRVSSDALNIGIAALLITTLLASGLMFFIMRTVTREIKDLNTAVRTIMDGNLEYQIETKRKDELGQLIGSFNEMARELQRTDEIRRNFISDLSHDLRSPLTSVIGYVQGLQDGTVPEERRIRTLHIVEDESRRLLKLTNDILDLSIIQSGQLILNPSDFDMHQMLLQAADTFEERIDRKHIHLIFDLEKQSPLVHGDPHQIARVVTNLVDNAVKFTEEGGTLQIKTEQKGDKLLVGIRNTGTLIDESQLNRIWSRFSKLDASRGLEKHSSGLGLAIVREILKAHGEKIDVYSNEYIGTLFIFSLPLRFKEQ